MSVERFKDVADMPPPPATRRVDPATIENMKALLSLSSHLPPLYEPGVYRYRSIEESYEARVAAELKRMRLLRIHKP